MRQSSIDPGVFAFCPELTELLQSRRVVGRNGKVFDGLGALSSRNNLLTLRCLMLEFGAERTLEIGLSFGGSALVFTASHKHLGRLPELQHVALDPFQKTVWDSTGVMAVERAGLSGYLDFRPAFSALELPRMVERGERFGLIYVDGSHLFEDVFVDAYFVVRLLSEGGIVAFDDSTDPHVAKVLRFLRRGLQTGLEEVDLRSFRVPGEGGVAYRVARLFGRVQLTAFRRVGAVERLWNSAFVSF